jgi:hypothetical protein
VRISPRKLIWVGIDIVKANVLMNSRRHLEALRKRKTLEVPGTREWVQVQLADLRPTTSHIRLPLTITESRHHPPLLVTIMSLLTLPGRRNL